MIEKVEQHRLGPLQIVDVEDHGRSAATDSSNRRTSQKSSFASRHRPRKRSSIAAAGSPTSVSASISGQNVIPSP